MQFKTVQPDDPMTVLGVPGRLLYRVPKFRSANLWQNQRWLSERRPAPGFPDNHFIRAELRFDDCCGNGHNSFAITADVFVPGRHDIEAGGCLHDEIAEAFPELAPLIRWHLCSDDGPVHYEANTIYLAGDRDYNGKRAGEPIHYKHSVQFDGVPIRHQISESLALFISERSGSGGEFRVGAISHPREPDTFGLGYAPIGYTGLWHECPWRDYTEAQDFCDALNQCTVHLDEIPVRFSQGKERELDAARRAACWPGATDAELSVEPEELRKRLRERLPGLLYAFQQEMEHAGFLWCPEDESTTS